ncbi:hypothetical protein GCM10028794_25670 [Silanimonas algicola]
MNPRLLMHQDGRWLAFDGSVVAVLDARPRVERATIVLTDFDGAVSDVASLEGSPSHAVALIERRLRSDGLIDGDAKVLVHQVRTVGNGYQALYTAVPLDRWQQLFAWADQQDDHCLLVPVVALLWKRLRPGQGVVLHSGRKLVFLASLRSGPVYASALAFSDSRADLAMTVAALGERAGMLLSAGDDGAVDAPTIEWIGAMTALGVPHGSTGTGRSRRIEPALSDPPLDEVPTERNPQAAHAGPSMSFDGQDEYADTPAVAANPAPAIAGVPGMPVAADAPLDEALLEIFAANSGATVRLAPHAVVTDASGHRHRSGVPALLADASPAVAVNSGVARAMFAAERLLPWASVASLVLAIGLAALGGRWTLSAHEARSGAATLRADTERLEERATAIEGNASVPAEYPAVLDFVGRASTLAQALDPTATLVMLRDAAGEDVRILRLRLDPTTDGSHSLRVDGLVNYGASPGGVEGGQQIARFVQRLRESGYVPTAVDPQSGNARAGAAGGVFSYQLTRAPAAAPGAMP